MRFSSASRSSSWGKGRRGRRGARPDPTRLATRPCIEDERKDKKKVPLKIEQTAAAEWVKSEGWDTMCDHREGEGLLQHVVDMGGVQVSWTDAFRQWGKSLLATSDVV